MVERRAPSKVMRLSRLGSLHQCRLSFMRQLTRRMGSENWQFSRTEFDINADGEGYAVYTVQTTERCYSLIAFAHDLPDELRSDRVIATAWDATFVLFDGVPSPEDISRLERQVPLQEAGRIGESELTLSRANRSVRLWEHVVNSLSTGEQPALGQIEDVGYLMRTTAVYGSGKFGAADREVLESRSEFQAPFQVEMLTVYLIRWFVRDLVNHMARQRGGSSAVSLTRDISEKLGIGNSTGLGMAPFLINHPVLFNNWIIAREEAIARVRSLPHATPTEIDRFVRLFNRSKFSIAQWRSKHPVQIQKLDALSQDLVALTNYLSGDALKQANPWDTLFHWSEETLSEEGQELVASLILEPYGALVDGLTSCMADQLKDAFVIDGSKTVSETKTAIQRSFGWSETIDWDARENCARAWYVSEEKLEPRLGERFEEPIADYEQPLAPARDAAAALRDLSLWPQDTPIADVLAQHPEHRHTIRRAQFESFAPYCEIQDNTISSDVMPIDMLRAKLSFFGATHFDPRSDRWVRICMYAGAPYPEDLKPENADFWIYPEGGL